MDDLDIKLKNIFLKNINTSDEYKNTIKNALYSNKEFSKLNLLKIAATFILSIGVTIGIVYASITTYQNIWIEPRKLTRLEDGFPQYSTTLTEDDKKKVNSEEEAVEIAKDFIKQMGYGEPEIYSIELKKNYTICAELVYVVKTKKNIEQGLEVCIDAETSKCVSFNDRDLKYEDFKPDEISEDKALDIAKDIYLKLGLKEKEYELKTIEKMSHFFQNKGKDMWNVTFAKKYDDTFNYFERVYIVFVVKDGKVRIDMAYYCNEYNFEDHPIILSKEDAIEIAKEKDRKITNLEIENIDVKLQIRLMNSFIYVQEMSNGKENGLVTEVREDGSIVSYLGYAAPEMLRKVWVVSINYTEQEYMKQEYLAKTYEELNENLYQEYISRTYFVDTTTGEIIGGEGTPYQTIRY